MDDEGFFEEAAQYAAADISPWETVDTDGWQVCHNTTTPPIHISSVHSSFQAPTVVPESGHATPEAAPSILTQAINSDSEVETPDGFGRRRVFEIQLGHGRIRYPRVHGSYGFQRCAVSFATR